MNEPLYMLDTSALLTLIEDEPGAQRVEAVLRSNQVAITWMSLLEVSYVTRQELGDAEAEHRYALLKSLPVALIWQIDEAALLQAARLKASFRLSLADSIIAAYAIQAGAILLHKDPEFEALSGLLTLESLPYK